MTKSGNPVKANGSLEQQSGISTNERIWYTYTLVASIIFLLLYVAATIVPSSKNWGIHHLAFVPFPVQLFILMLMAAMLLPPIQKYLIEFLEKILSTIQRQSRSQHVVFAVSGIVLFGLLFWIGKEEHHLLGDGILLTRKISMMQGMENIPEYFPNEPLAGMLLYTIRQLIPGMGIAEPAELPFQVLSIISGLGFITIAGFLAGMIVENFIQKVFLFIAFVTTGASELFFGYVEMYTLSCCFLSLFLYLAVKYFRDNISIIYPMIAFALLVTSHFAMLCLLPAVLMLLYRNLKSGLIENIIAVFLPVLVFGSIMMLCKFNWNAFVGIFLNGSSHILSLSLTEGNAQPYSLFSFSHIGELSQLHLLISPFALCLLIGSLWIFRKRIPWGDRVVQFFLLVAACGCICASLLNPELGLSRDWDAFSPLLLGFAMGGGGILFRLLPYSTPVKRTMIMILGISLLHVISWVSVNANGEQALVRFQALPSEHVWTKQAQLDAYEELAIFYRNREDGVHSIENYRRYLSIDSANPRIWGSLAYVYRLMGDEDNQLLAYEGAIRHDSRDDDVYAGLGMLLVNRNVPARAVTMLQQALSINSHNVDALFYLGSAFFKRGDYQQALAGYKQTIAIAPGYVEAYLGAADVYLHNSDTTSANAMYREYLRYAPPSLQRDMIRRKLDGKY